MAALKRAPHPDCRGEARLGRPHYLEAELLVEPLSRARRDLNPMRPVVPRALARVLHERSPDSLLHLSRLDEQTIELVRAALTRNDHAEADRNVVVEDSHPRPTVVNETLRELDRIRVSRELPPVLLP